MTIRTTNTTPRPVVLTGAKPPASEPAQDGPLLTVPEYPKRDRLQLSPQVTQETKAEAGKVGAALSETSKTETTAGPDAKKSEPSKRLLRNHGLYRPFQDPFTQQEAVMEKALAGQAVSFTNTSGASLDLKVIKEDNTKEGYEQYKLQVGSGTIKVTAAPGLDTKTLMAKMLDFYTKVPEHLRGDLKEVVLDTRQNPKDEYWAKVYGRNTFSSAASAGEGLITFWHLNDNPINLSEDTFHHEMGHLIGESFRYSNVEYNTHMPKGWPEAAKADDDKVSNYAGMNLDEDFAETWSYYLFARTDTEAMEALRERVPNRVNLLEAIYENKFDSKTGKGKSHD